MGQEKSFWALVRSISEEAGYTHKTRRGEPRGSGRLKIHTPAEQAGILARLGLDPSIVFDGQRPTYRGMLLHQYFQYRAQVLQDFVRPRLMDADEAKALFEAHRLRLGPTCVLPLNKQKGEKSGYAYFTGLINMLIQEGLHGLECDFDPRRLTTFTHEGIPLRTLSRRVDGAFPSTINPLALWEIKEYYYTTTFGSRVADGVYETLLDGLELEELFESEGIRADHILFVDAYFTWWICGKSYLCRMIDMLHMGFVQEVIFGSEVVDRVPSLTHEWLDRHAAERAG